MQAWTLYSKSADTITRRLTHLLNGTQTKSHSAIFTLSTNTPPNALSPLVERLTSISPRHIGCLSAPASEGGDDIVCSVAVIPEGAASWRSEIRGEREAVVGRWHSMREKQEGKASEEMADIPESVEALGKDISSFIYFADGEPQQMTRLLARNYPSATQLGLRASRSIFLTGREYTLFHDSKIHSDGLVGMALRVPVSNLPRDGHGLMHGLQSIGKEGIITKSVGNLVHEIGKKNPSKLLMDALYHAKVREEKWKDERVFVGISSRKGADESSKFGRYYEVSAGGPSRGMIAIDANVEGLEGCAVQFFRFNRKIESSEPPAMELRPDSMLFKFGVESHVPRLSAAAGKHDEVRVIPNTLTGFSEHSFVYRSPDDELEGKLGPGWTCSVPGAWKGLEYSQHDGANDAPLNDER